MNEDVVRDSEPLSNLDSARCSTRAEEKLMDADSVFAKPLD